MAKKTYFVTETAGRLVAGARSPGVGRAIELSDAQAEHPLRLGHIAEALPEPVVEQTGEDQSDEAKNRRRPRGTE